MKNKWSGGDRCEWEGAEVIPSDVDGDADDESFEPRATARPEC